MASNSHRRSATPAPPAQKRQVKQKRQRRRKATVYDAVAGRISAKGFIRDKPLIASTRETAYSSTIPVSAASIIFKRKKLYKKFEEDEFNSILESLCPKDLPESDLSKAIHCYASDFYSMAVKKRLGKDYRSMDETALLAFGVLMEEMCRESLGKTGHLVFTELSSVGHNPTQKHQKSTQEAESSVVSTSDAAIKSGQTRRAKRRRLDTEISTTSDN